MDGRSDAEAAAEGADGQPRAALCRIAGLIDTGIFEAAGFSMEGRTWRPGASGCCTLDITPGPAARGPTA